MVSREGRVAAPTPLLPQGRGQTRRGCDFIGPCSECPVTVVSARPGLVIQHNEVNGDTTIMTTSSLARQPEVIIGVDAHKNTHHAVIITDTGNRIADQEFPANTHGYADMLSWAHDHGTIQAFGVESTGSYAAGLARFLIDHQVEVREVNTPHAHTKARVGKDDAIDAEAAARKVLAGVASAIPKRTDSVIESIRFLTLTRDSAVKARTAAIVQLQDILVTAPANLRENVPSGGLAAARHCRKFRIDRARLNDPVQAVKLALRTLGARIADLDAEITELERSLTTLVHATAPTLVSRVGIGAIHAAQLLITVGENVERFHSEAAFARLCGVAPVPVSSGKSHRMRLHRGGDRKANRALHMIAIVRLRYDARTIDYMQRRLAEGLSKKDVLRCLKRFIAREVYNDLRHDLIAA